MSRADRWKPYIGPSEAQSRANAEALARRDATYTAASGRSFETSWDYHRREPKDLREAVYMARRAYSDEVPAKLHEGPDSIGEGGTPKYATNFLRYIDTPHATDALPGEDPLLVYRLYPWQATLAAMSASGKEWRRAFGAIASHVSVGSMDGGPAAEREGVPHWAADIVAEAALRCVLKEATDLKIRLHKEEVAA